MVPIVYNIEEWLTENKKFFVPPICNKLMYKDGQLKTFFVGGPNIRKDFHMEEGEEFFYMLRGDMKLIIVQQGQFKDVIIKEGEVFLLPARIPHSPQRSANTIGLVIERERAANEMDCLRYYMDKSTEILYQRWFHCDSLDTQLPPLIKEFFASEECRTRKPLKGPMMQDEPLQQDHKTIVNNPFLLNEWIKEHYDELGTKGKKTLFEGNFASRIAVLGKGEHFGEEDLPETFLWQLQGDSVVKFEGLSYELKQNSTMLINKGEIWCLTNEEGSVTMSVVMNPK